MFWKKGLKHANRFEKGDFVDIRTGAGQKVCCTGATLQANGSCRVILVDHIVRIQPRRGVGTPDTGRLVRAGSGRIWICAAVVIDRVPPGLKGRGAS